MHAHVHNCTHVYGGGGAVPCAKACVRDRQLMHVLFMEPNGHDRQLLVDEGDAFQAKQGSVAAGMNGMK